MEEVEVKYLRHKKKKSSSLPYYSGLYKEIIKELDGKGRQKKAGEKRKYKKRLFIGEGAFHYTVAFLLKHPELAGFIVATELDSIKELAGKHNDFEKNLNFLLSLNVDIRFGIDAKKLHEDSKLKGKHFKRIHFNFPYHADSDDEKNKKLIEQFFKSAKELQRIGDRIYVVLPKPKDHWDRKRRQGMVYSIYSACTRAGYMIPYHFYV